MSDDAKITPATPPASNGPSGGPPEPFVRKQVTWGRMPTTTFHVGPVPVAPNPLDRIPNRPPRTTPLGQTGPSGGQVSGQVQEPPRRVPAPRAGGNILSGSLIPQARPRSGPVTPAPQPEPAPAPVPVPSADTTVRPLPGAGLTNAPSAPVDQPDVAEQAAATPVVAAPALAPLEPSPAVEAAPSVTPSFARAATRRPSRLPLYIGVGVLAVLAVGGGLWFALRSQPSAEAPPVTTPEAAAPVSTPPAAPKPESQQAATPEPAPVAAAPVAPRPQQTTTPPPARATTPAPAARPAPTPAQPRPTIAPAPAASTPAPVPSATVEPPPVVVVPQGPAPTPARPAQTDPNAPIVTRPQPLD